MPPRRSSSESSAGKVCERSPDLGFGLGNFALSGVFLKSVIYVFRAALGVEESGRDEFERSPGGRIEGELDIELSSLGIPYPEGKLGVGISLSSSYPSPIFNSLNCRSFLSNGDSILLSQLSFPVNCFLPSGVDAVAPLPNMNDPSSWAEENDWSWPRGTSCSWSWYVVCDSFSSWMVEGPSTVLRTPAAAS